MSLPRPAPYLKDPEVRKAIETLWRAFPITGADVATGTITDTDLASPNNSTYKTLLVSGGFIGVDTTAATYLLGTKTNGFVPSLLNSSGGQWSIGNDALPPDLIYFDDADYTVASKTQKLRLRCQVLANATAPGINFTFGLYPVTVAGAADTMVITAGTVVSSSTQAINTPSASTVTSAVNSDFTIPSDGAYVLGVVTSGTIANNSLVSCHATLQSRNV